MPPDQPAQSSIPLDARHPLRLDGPDGAYAGRVYAVLTGPVDIFAQPYLAGRPAGARTPLFRVEAGELLLGLPPAAVDEGREVAVLAIGGQSSEVAVIERSDIVGRTLLEQWIERLGTALQIDPPETDGQEIVRAVAGSRAELPRGTCLVPAARGVAWVTIESGRCVLMDDAAMGWAAADGPVPLAGGLWLRAAEDAIVNVADQPSDSTAWAALDRLHRAVPGRLRRLLDDETAAAVARLGRRRDAADRDRGRLLLALARTVRAMGEIPPVETAPVDPLLAACRAIGDALGLAIVRPAGELAGVLSGDAPLRAVERIARTSRLRVRRVLLRQGWWRSTTDPLVAWREADRQPIAVIATSPHFYTALDPATGIATRLDEAAAAGLMPEAVTFYSPFPDGPIPVGRLLAWSVRQAGGDLGRLLGGSLALALAGLLPSIVIEIVVNAVVPRSDLDQLAYCAAALFMAVLGTAAFQAIQGVALLRVNGVLDRALQAAVIDRLLRLPVLFFKDYTVGDLADRVLGIDEIRQVLTGRSLSGVMAGVFSVFGFALMFCYQPRLAAAASGLAVLNVAVIVAVSAARLREERRHFDAQGKVQGLVLQFLTGIGKLRVAGATTRALAIWAPRFARQKRHFIASQRAANLLATFQAGFPTAATLVIFALALDEPAGHAGGRAHDIGAFLAFFAAFGQTLAALAALGTSLGDMLIAVPYFSRLAPVLAAPVESAASRQDPGNLTGSFQFTQVTFRYHPDGAAILDRLSFSVEPGEYVALVGASGSGKSTIFRLLLGFERPQSGAILYDGRSIETLEIGALRRQIGVVLQNGKLTSGNIYENICGAVPVPVEQAWQAARFAGFDADIEAMPMGMHTMITEGMSTLSGGQRQRLMIARALVHRPRLLLFDEATSALDNRTQSVVSASLAKLDVTRIVIAHRLSTIQDADRIIVLSHGAVAQMGTFAELSAQPGIFAEMAGRQML